MSSRPSPDLSEVIDGSDLPLDVFSFETVFFHGQLNILDGGAAAVFRRRQKIRFLEDDVGLFIDRVWGDGLILRGYSLSRGLVIADVIRAKKGYVIVVQLHRRFNKGEYLEIETERRIVGAFKDVGAFWELSMNAPTRQVSLEISSKDRRLSDPEIVAPARGELAFKQSRRSAMLTVERPALYTPYRVEWAWK